jgi:hypothetical protein
MALSAAVLAELIKSKSAVKQADPAAPEGWFVDILAEAIVEHITTQAQVVVVSVSGVTTGPSVSGPGTGTIV